MCIYFWRALEVGMDDVGSPRGCTATWAVHVAVTAAPLLSVFDRDGMT